MSQGQTLSDLFEAFVTKFEDNPFKNEKRYYQCQSF